DHYAAAIEKDGEARAHRILKLGLIERLVLRLTGQDQPARVRGGGFERLFGKEKEAGLQDGEQDGQKGNGDDREFDRCRAILAAHQIAEFPWCFPHDRNNGSQAERVKSKKSRHAALLLDPRRARASSKELNSA